MLTCAELFDGKLAQLIDTADLLAEDIVARYNRWPATRTTFKCFKYGIDLPPTVPDRIRAHAII